MFESSISCVTYDAESLRGKGLIVTENDELGLSIVRYHKSDNDWKNRTHGKCNRKDPVVRAHRSVVYTLTTGVPVSVAPIRRIPHDEIGNNAFVGKDDDYVVTEYLDGTMINVFWNSNLNADGDAFGWTLASRSKIHATCRFTSDRLFRDLFEEARVKSGVEYEALNKLYGYTFILLHPETRRVLAYDSPRIVLVSVSECVPVMCETEEDVSFRVNPLSWDAMVSEGNRIAPNILPTQVDVPASRVLERSMCPDVVGTLAGWMITKRSGAWGRVRVLTDAFEECAKLRGDTASRTTNYLRLMSLDPKGTAIRDYADWYPEESGAIRKLGDALEAAIKELVDCYVSRHVKRTMEHTDLPHWTRRPIWDLHGRYLRSRVPIKDREVFAYFRDISPSAVNRMLKNREKELRKQKERDGVHVDAEAAEAEAATEAGEDTLAAATGIAFA